MKRLKVTATKLEVVLQDGSRLQPALLEKTWKFWPSWAELEAECEHLVSARRPRLALTCGEPAGIGPDLAVMLAANPPPAGTDYEMVVVVRRDAIRTVYPDATPACDGGGRPASCACGG